jgi:very-short-patch-repair endonuclease
MPLFLSNKKLWFHLKPQVRDNRKNPTEVEKILWKHLRNKKLMGHKIRRQHAIHVYIVDFVCYEKRLVIELDGSVHDKQKEYDIERTKVLNDQGFRVIRFRNSEVTGDLASVIERIKSELTSPPNPLS